MTDAECDAIIFPAEGLLVYCSNCLPKGAYSYNGLSREGIGALTIAENAVYGTNFFNQLKLWRYNLL